MLGQSVIRIWKNRNQIVEGVVNSVFKKEDVELIAEERMSICRRCPSGCFDQEGTGCMIPGTQPCCNQDKGGCGCSLGFKTRALSSACPLEHWPAEISEDEEIVLKEKLGI
jgi:hypothetical protein